MRAAFAVALLVLGMAALSCGDSTTSEPEPDPDPIPGWLKVRLTTSNGDDGGIMFTVSGPQIDSVRSSYPDFFKADSGPASVRIIVAGHLTSGGVVAEVLVPDVQSPDDYTATVEQLAARDTYEQRPVASASLAVAR
ncbi:MAG: hypothetical protein PVJ76_13985 [Gemmatimonadota bacterium]|jgi:hypothetical protein